MPSPYNVAAMNGEVSGGQVIVFACLLLFCFQRSVLLQPETLTTAVKFENESISLNFKGKWKGSDCF